LDRQLFVSCGLELGFKTAVYKFAVSQEKAFLTGSGVGRPLGIFIASTSGISTSRDVSTGNSSTAITFDGLIESQVHIEEPVLAKGPLDLASGRG